MLNDQKLRSEVKKDEIFMSSDKTRLYCQVNLVTNICLGVRNEAGIMTDAHEEVGEEVFIELEARVYVM